MHFERYEVQKRLAAGGMAEVFLSKGISHEGFERPLVIKRILPQVCRDDDFVATFLNEARLASCLKHPNIVQIFDLGRFLDSYFLSMEYVRGYDLATIIAGHVKAGINIPLDIGLHIGLDLFNGLDFAHYATDKSGSWLGIVHRDVTPGNVIVSFDGGAKILDFGIAKATAHDSGHTSTGTIKGKIAYLAPEQIMGGVVDKRVDVFAGSLTIYQMLSNVNPNQGQSAYESINNSTTRDVPDIRDYRPEVPEQIARILSHGLQRDTSKRYETCRDFARDLKEVITTLDLSTSEQAVTAYLRAHEHLFAPLAQVQAKSSVGSDISGHTLYLKQSTAVSRLLDGSSSQALNLGGQEICDAQIANHHGVVPSTSVLVDLPSTEIREVTATKVKVGWAAVALVLLTVIGGAVFVSREDSRASFPPALSEAPLPAVTTGDVVFETDPPGAMVQLSRQEASGFVLLSGSTPLTTSVPLDWTFDYKVSLSGHRIARGSVRATAGEDRMVRVDLRRE